MLKLYDTLRSGNAWKVRILAAFLGIPLERCTLSIDRGDLLLPFFRDVAILGQVPVLELADHRRITESMAILFYLADGTPWWPSESFSQANVITWLSFEQDRHMKPLALLRLHLAIRRDRDPASAEFRSLADEASGSLSLLEEQLRRQGPQAWVATTQRPSIADVALYPYTSMAPMGGIALQPYPAIGDWLDRFEQLPGYQALFPGEPERNHSTEELR